MTRWSEYSPLKDSLQLDSGGWYGSAQYWDDKLLESVMQGVVDLVELAEGSYEDCDVEHLLVSGGWVQVCAMIPRLVNVVITCCTQVSSPSVPVFKRSSGFAGTS